MQAYTALPQQNTVPGMTSLPVLRKSVLSLKRGRQKSELVGLPRVSHVILSSLVVLSVQCGMNDERNTNAEESDTKGDETQEVYHIAGLRSPDAMAEDVEDFWRSLLDVARKSGVPVAENLWEVTVQQLQDIFGNVHSLSVPGCYRGQSGVWQGFVTRLFAVSASCEMIPRRCTILFILFSITSGCNMKEALWSRVIWTMGSRPPTTMKKTEENQTLTVASQLDWKLTITRTPSLLARRNSYSGGNPRTVNLTCICTTQMGTTTKTKLKRKRKKQTSMQKRKRRRQRKMNTSDK